MVRVSAVLFKVEFDLMSHLPIFAVQQKLGCNLIHSDFAPGLTDCRPCFLAVLGHIG